MPQPMKGAPAVELAALTMLTAHLATELDNVWAAWAAQDAIDTTAGINPPPKVYPVRLHRGPRKLSYSTPDIAIMVTDSTVLDAIETAWTYWEHHLAIVVTCTSSDEMALDEMVKRYVVALWQCFSKYPQLDGTTLMGNVGAYVVEQAKGMPLTLKEQTNLTQEGGVLVAVRVDESA
jgi:hypothetical protein